MAQKLTAGLLRNILSSQCRKLHTLPNLSFKTPTYAILRMPRSLQYTVVQRPNSTDVALRDFLKEEIEAEKEVAKKQLGTQPAPTISGFQVHTDEADVKLTKTFNNEKITILFNVNECVRPQDDPETGTMDRNEMRQQQEQGETKDEQDYSLNMYAEPAFRVEIEKKNQKLVFECEFVPEYASEEPVTDDESEIFNISAVYMTTGEVTDKVYGASGEILDGTLYDHLFDYLAERGVDSKFANELVTFATHYEHAQYVNLLQKLKEFVSHN